MYASDCEISMLFHLLPPSGNIRRFGGKIRKFRKFPPKQKKNFHVHFVGFPWKCAEAGFSPRHRNEEGIKFQEEKKTPKLTVKKKEDRNKVRKKEMRQMICPTCVFRLIHCSINSQPVYSQTEVAGNRMSIRLGIKINEALPCEWKYEILVPLS